MRFAFLFLLVLSSNWVNAQKLKLILPIGHTKQVFSALFNPDGKKVVTASSDGTAKVWDAETGQLLLDLQGHKESVNEAKFNADGKKIVTASADRTVKIWDAINGKLLFSFENLFYSKTACFSNDGTMVAASSSEKVKLWNPNNGQLLLTLETSPYDKLSDWVDFIDFSPDSKQLLTTTNNVTQVWSTETGKLRFQIPRVNSSLSSYPTTFFNADGTKLITTTDEQTVEIWDVVEGIKVFILSGHTNMIRSAVFSADGEKVVTASEDSTTKVWSAKTGKLVLNIKKDDTRILGAQFSPDSRTIITENAREIEEKVNGKLKGTIRKGFIKQWDAKTGKLISRKIEFEGLTSNAHFSPNGRKILFTTSFNNYAQIWNSETGTIHQMLQGYTSSINTAHLSPDGRHILIASGQKEGKVWDLTTGELVLSLAGHKEQINTAVFSKDGSKIITSSDDSTVKIWSAKNGAILRSITGWNGRVTYAEFSHDGKRIIVVTDSLCAKICDAVTGKTQINFNGWEREYLIEGPARFSRDGSRILTTQAFDQEAVLWDGEMRKYIYKFLHKDFISSANFSPDQTKIITTSMDKTVKVWSAKTGELLNVLTGHEGEVSSAEFSADNKKIVTACHDNTVKIWDAETGKILTNLFGHINEVNSAEFSPDGSKVITTADDFTIKIWNTKTGTLCSTFFIVDSSDYVFQTSSLNYKSTKNASRRLHYVTSNSKVITFEQLDVKYNRPDKVLEALGSSDTALIKSYYKAYEKRIKKLGIDTTSFREGYSTPESDFANRDAVDYEQREQQIKLHISGKDSTYLLDRFNVWINENPLYGLRGISLKNRHTHQFDTTFTILLSDGRNQIETSVTDVNGTESYRVPLYVNYVPQKPDSGKLHFIGIGINRFASNQNNLSWSVKDVRDLATSFKAKYGSTCIIDTLFDEAVTTANVAALKKKLLQTGVNDKVIIAYSGHGLLSKDYDYYLSTYNINFSKPEEGGLPYDVLESLLDSIPARKKLMLIDACHSGEVDKEEMQQYQRIQQQLDSTKKGVYVLVNKDEKRLGTKNSFELMQQLFVNVGRSTGATIISAAAGTQFALERNNLQNGVFTYSILEYMKNHPHVSINELKKYVNQRVPELTQGAQVPTARSETNSVDWEVW